VFDLYAINVDLLPLRVIVEEGFGGAFVVVFFGCCCVSVG